MSYYKDLFVKYMDEKGIRYTDIDDVAVRVLFNGDNLRSISIIMVFDREDVPMVQIRCWEIAKVPDDKVGSVLVACNEVSRRFRWAKFYVDKEYDIVGEADALFDENTCGPICGKLLNLVSSIVDDAYPIFMKAIWS